MSKETKEAFLEKFEGATFTLKEAVEFLEPEMDIDEQKALDDFIKNIARRFISIKKKGERVFVSYKKDGNIFYSNPQTETDLEALENMKKQLERKEDGIRKTRRTVLKRQYMLRGQLMFGEDGVAKEAIQ